MDRYVNSIHSAFREGMLDRYRQRLCHCIFPRRWKEGGSEPPAYMTSIPTKQIPYIICKAKCNKQTNKQQKEKAESFIKKLSIST